MRRFHVPQFIEVEDKLFGPFTLKQFIYTLGGLSLGFIFWIFLPKILAVLIGLPIVAFGFALAFYKVNDRPFLDIVTNAVFFSSHPRLYLWKKEEKKKHGQKQAPPNKISGLELPKAGKGKLNDLAWSLDIKEEFKENK